MNKCCRFLFWFLLILKILCVKRIAFKTPSKAMLISGITNIPVLILIFPNEAVVYYSLNPQSFF